MGYLIYKIADEIGNTVNKLMDNMANQSFLSLVDIPEFARITHKLLCDNQNNNVFFPDEEKESWMIDKGNENEIRFHQETICSVIKKWQYSIEFSSRGDGFSKSFLLPYYTTK